MPTGKQQLSQQLHQYENEASMHPVSRKVGMAALLKTAPAYTFGGRYKQIQGEGTPGPGAYAPFGSYETKGAGFGTSARLSRQADVTPSPLDYAPSVAPVRPSASAYSFRSKNAGKQRPESTPGPGAYDAGASKDKQRPSNPPVTMGPKLKPPSDADKKPGPDAYSPIFSPKEPHSASIKFRHTARSYEFAGPGPGAYEADPSPSKTRGPTMGGKRAHASGQDDSPGPVYDPTRSYEAILPGKAAYTFPRASSHYHASEGPGPGSYTQPPVVERPAGFSAVSDCRSQPAYTMQGKPFFSRAAAQPGPSDYSVRDNITRRSAPAASFHGSSIKDSRDSYPAPNAYAYEDVHKVLHPANPPVTIAPRYPEPHSKDRKPGPADYSPNWQPKEVHAPSIKFRHHPRFYDQMHGTPAPHDYADKDFASPYLNTGKLRKGKTFGIRHLKKGKEDVPGPHYAIGCSTLGIAANDKVDKRDLARSHILL
mmetsp:Transcript_11635/g.31718  ORF Transcript_11635/g.31718 Transcript_11635/m.31718 type:complete len:481 (+) Transcript_11635:288-1730(+)|eukprot:CAMPEP_0202397936 /NCGR_PEP_ID=MMETSP1128-20130828/939_1 /ASSEMBLY_ACC=CAM_ASM_000463 /TAXON_ID=3047 /ORGANISM="Dunaliella tertiolecta, Strain CCMP1320" /LENGTH=480 /DNA_ID=CAMNT_0049000965 /DNA_START=284 /DNA_END=1726 /DNA_ORIENTATION=-